MSLPVEQSRRASKTNGRKIVRTTDSDSRREQSPVRSPNKRRKIIEEKEKRANHKNPNTDESKGSPRNASYDKDPGEGDKSTFRRRNVRRRRRHSRAKNSNQTKEQAHPASAHNESIGLARDKHQESEQNKGTRNKKPQDSEEQNQQEQNNSQNFDDEMQGEDAQPQSGQKAPKIMKGVTGRLPKEILKNVFNNYKVPQITSESLSAPAEMPLPKNPFLYNELQFMSVILAHHGAVRFLYKLGMFFNPKKCPRTVKVGRKRKFCCAKKPHFYTYSRSKDGKKKGDTQYFKCKKCGKKTSIFHGSWMEHFNRGGTSLQGLCLILWHFVKGTPAYEVYKYFTCQNLAGPKVVYRAYRLFRYVMRVWLIAFPLKFVSPTKGSDAERCENGIQMDVLKQDKAELYEQMKQGQKEKDLLQREKVTKSEPLQPFFGDHQKMNVNVVAADESHQGHKHKDKRGVAADQFILFGISTAKGTQMLMWLVGDKKRETIMPYLEQHVDFGGAVEIWTDEAKIYDTLPTKIHRTVKHKETFKNYISGCNTNAIEGGWTRFMRVVQRCNGILGSTANLQTHLDEFCFRNNFRDEDGSIAAHFCVALKTFHKEAHYLMKFDMKHC